MSRYIDAKLIEPFFKRGEWDTPDERWRPESELGRFIDAIPTADVQEVKHGRWDFDEYGWVCSVCGYPMPRRFGKSNYCPKCGSLMVDEDE